MKKLMKKYKELGLVYALESFLMYPLQRICNIYNDLIIRKRYSDKKEILKTVNGYKMVLYPHKKGVHKDLLIHPTREPESTNFLKTKVKDGDVVLEAGANIGYYALLSAKYVGKKGFVYCVEPSSENYEFLKRNKEINNLKNMELRKMALGDKNGEETLNLFEGGNLNTLKKNISSKPRGKEKVKVMTIDSFLKNKRKPNIIRMDVEGSEYEIIKGARELLEKSPPKLIFIELHGFYMGLEKSEELLRNLKEKGYEISFFSLEKNIPANLPILGNLMNKITKKRDSRIMKTKKMTIEKLINNKNLLKNYSPGIFFEHKDNKFE